MNFIYCNRTYCIPSYYAIVPEQSKKYFVASMQSHRFPSFERVEHIVGYLVDTSLKNYVISRDSARYSIALLDENV